MVEIYEVAEVTQELVDAFNRLVPQVSNSAPPPRETELRRIVESDSSILFVAKFESLIVGTLTLVVFPIPTGIRAMIEDVVVDKDDRRNGAGEALTKAALARAKLDGAKTVDLTSRPFRLAANQLYQKLGFKRRETNVYRFEIC